MKKYIPVIIPAKNEELRIEETIVSIRETFDTAKVESKIIVVDDGSNDKTIEIISRLNCNFIELKDRGYSALGKPELADTHNAGFQYIKNFFNYDEYDYIMVVGADTTFEPNYLIKVLKEFKNNKNLVMCAGIIDGLLTNKRHVRGSGRLIKKSFWIKYGEKLPNKVHAWESHPIYWANFKGYDTLTLKNAIMRTSRPPMKNVDWKRYGKAMREYGSLFIYVLFRSLRTSVKINPYQAIRLIYGYLEKPKYTYETELMIFIKKFQKRKILNFLKGKMK